MLAFQPAHIANYAGSSCHDLGLLTVVSMSQQAQHHPSLQQQSWRRGRARGSQASGRPICRGHKVCKLPDKKQQQQQQLVVNSAKPAALQSWRRGRARGSQASGRPICRGHKVCKLPDKKQQQQQQLVVNSAKPAALQAQRHPSLQQQSPRRARGRRRKA